MASMLYNVGKAAPDCQDDALSALYHNLRLLTSYSFLMSTSSLWNRRYIGPVVVPASVQFR